MSRHGGLFHIQPDAQTSKFAACFARRVKFAPQKYISFRKTEVMI
jgi:hypothetical protein